MGGAVSAGADNDELIDNLLEADYIRTAAVERVFRAVDRGHYFTVEYKERAYRDIAWKYGNLHISAPCIYSKVMEYLKLAPGLSFLNLGSGTGYLSTMAGLILGPYGINHGIEIHEDVLNYATSKLEEFITTSSAIDEYEFCQPKFVCGDCLNLGSGARQYDRVYCSAACPENHENYMKNLIKVGGILVIPINDQLYQICRISDTTWESKSVLPVSFTTLVSGKISDCQEPIKMPDTDPLSLQDICRFVVRSILRQNIDIEHPELKTLRRVPKKRMRKRALRQFVFPIFHSNSEEEDDDDSTFQFCRSVFGENQILRGPSAAAGDMETERTSEANSQNSSISSNRVVNDIIMEEGSIFDIGLEDTPFLFEKMSSEELLSDFDELDNILTMSETSTSTVTSGSDSESGKQKVLTETGGAIKQKIKTKTKYKQKKLDSGIVEDIETGEGGSDSEKEDAKNVEQKCGNTSGDEYPFLKVTDSDTDTESCENTCKEENEEKKSASTSFDNSPSVNVVNYTTYMKEKIKLLPLPMTLKYFLNLNRDL